MANLIIINDFISSCKGITSKEAEPIYDKIYESLSHAENVILDFKDIELTTTAFLNVLIGNLYGHFESNMLKKMIEIRNINDPTAVRIKKVTDNAKVFYSNEKKELSSRYDSILKEND